MAQRKEKATVGKLKIFAETRNDEGEITVTPTGLSLNPTDERAKSKRVGLNPFDRLGPRPKGTERNREALRARLGTKVDNSKEREKRRKTAMKDATPEASEANTRRRIIVGKVAQRIISGEEEDDDVNVETMTARQVKETYMKRYPEAGSRIYDTLITKSTPPDDKQHIVMSMQMMKQRDESRDPVLRENLLILGAYHLKVYHNLRRGRQ